MKLRELERERERVHLQWRNGVEQSSGEFDVCCSHLRFLQMCIDKANIKILLLLFLAYYKNIILFLVYYEVISFGVIESRYCFLRPWHFILDILYGPPLGRSAIVLVKIMFKYMYKKYDYIIKIYSII